MSRRSRKAQKRWWMKRKAAAHARAAVVLQGHGQQTNADCMPGIMPSYQFLERNIVARY